jgi:hypothetical protein
MKSKGAVIVGMMAMVCFLVAGAKVCLVQGNQRVTDNPVTVKGVSAEGAGKADIKISNDDARQIRSASENLSLMKKCRVMIVLD